MKTIAELSGVRSWMLYSNYKKVSDFGKWDQLSHARQYLVFPENIGQKLSIDELALSKGELYTYITNKAARGGKGALVASIHGTRTREITQWTSLIPKQKRLEVREVTLDMANNLARSVRQLFPNARLVTDRFHVMQLACDAVQQLRINLRWQETDEENEASKQAREKGEKFVAEELVNGDTPKQLLARSRYPLYKDESQWTNNQWLRLYLAFDRYPQLKKAYYHVQKLRGIYRLKERAKAKVALLKWIESARKLDIVGFERVADTLELHLETILNFFHNRSTNASAEAFNAKIKQFRAIQRGVRDTDFFLFRLSKLYG